VETPAALFFVCKALPERNCRTKPGLNKQVQHIVQDLTIQKKTMRPIFTIICCVALTAVARAEEFDANAKVKGQRADADADAQVQAQQPVVVPKVNQGVNPKFQTQGANRFQTQGGNRFQGNRNLSRAPFRNGPGNNNQAVRAFHHQHFNISTAPNPRIATVKFRANNRIEGSERWQGQRYSAFRSYHAQWHDRNWWRQHHTRIVLIGGGYYYWDGGYWYPAWGYDQGYAYYPYDGPIYTGSADVSPGDTVADVQAALQEQGYYHGEVDGLLGPLTRAALAEYQQAHGLYTTAAIDEPTLASLGMG
jgi:hypothetical protein